MSLSPVINYDIAISSIKKMINYNNDLSAIMSKYGIDFSDNVCRRNAMLSEAQEKFFANELVANGIEATSDGHVGQADIILLKNGKPFHEIECKLTSEKSGGGFSMQTDAETIENKVSLDYLYLLTNRSFNKFALLYFQQLNRYDFSAVSPGSRGKVKMIKHRAMKKCIPILGEVIDNRISYIDRLHDKVNDALDYQSRRIKDINDRIAKLNPSTVAYKKAVDVLGREITRSGNKIDKIKNKIYAKQNEKSSYSFNLVAV